MIKYSDVPDLKPGELLKMEILGKLAVFVKRDDSRCTLIWIYNPEQGKVVIADPHHWIRLDDEVYKKNFGL